MARNGFQIPPGIGPCSDAFLLPPNERPHLPTLQAVPVPQMKKRHQIIVGNEIALAGLTIKRPHDPEDFGAEQAVFQMAVKWKDGCVIFRRIGRPLLKVNREKSEPISVSLSSGLSAREAQ